MKTLLTQKIRGWESWKQNVYRGSPKHCLSGFESKIASGPTMFHVCVIQERGSYNNVSSFAGPLGKSKITRWRSKPQIVRNVWLCGAWFAAFQIIRTRNCDHSFVAGSNQRSRVHKCSRTCRVPCKEQPSYHIIWQSGYNLKPCPQTLTQQRSRASWGIKYCVFHFWSFL